MSTPNPATRLEPAERDALLRELPQWAYDANERGGAIRRRFVFADFVQAFGFMTQLALAAEKRDHHPEWSNVYSRVDILLTTHDCDGLSMRDIELARVADSLARGH